MEEINGDWRKLLNIVVEWLTLLLRILEVLGSNLGPKTGCPV
jgi:hypothetical protein